MTSGLKHADELYETLKKVPELYFETAYKEILYDQESEEMANMLALPDGYFKAHPDEKKLKQLKRNFYEELRDNRYRYANFGFFLKRLYDAFDQLFETEIKIINDQTFKFRKGIKIFYDYHPEANPEPLQDYNKLQKAAIAHIEKYCQDQQQLIQYILGLINQMADTALGKMDLDKPIKDEADSRIFIDMKPEEIRNYFSVLKQRTKAGSPILKNSDFEYFLSINFQGFDNATQKRELEFHLIGSKHMQYLIFRFYQKYSDYKGYNRKRWARLLKDTFPKNYTGKVENIASNFKEEIDNSTAYKFEDLGLKLPE